MSSALKYGITVIQRQMTLSFPNLDHDHGGVFRGIFWEIPNLKIILRKKGKNKRKTGKNSRKMGKGGGAIGDNVTVY